MRTCVNCIRYRQLVDRCMCVILSLYSDTFVCCSQTARKDIPNPGPGPFRLDKSASCLPFSKRHGRPLLTATTGTETETPE